MPTSEQPKANSPASSMSFVDHVWQYLASHPITAAWNASLLTGGVVFIGYFASIGFMPELDFQASVGLLVAAGSCRNLLFSFAYFTAVATGMDLDYWSDWR